MRVTIGLAVLLAIAGCGSETTATTSQPPTQQEIEVFCLQYEQVKHLSRSEMLEALVDHAPAAIAGSFKRASELGGSPEDDAVIDEIIDECRSDA